MSALSGRPVRVLQLSTRNQLGGVQVLVDAIHEGLTNQGLEVDDVALIREGRLVQRLSHLRRIAGRLIFGRYDAVLAYHPAASVVMGTLGPLGRVGTRLSHLSSMPDAIRRGWRVLDRVIGGLGGYTAVIPNSSATQEAFSTYPPGYTRRMRLIPHGIPPVGSPSGAVDWRARLGIPAGARVLVATGRLTDQKDHVTAIRALPLLPGAHLAIAGDGPERAAMLALAQDLGVTDRLHLAGSVQRAELADFLAMGEIYVFPSVWETFGIAGVEAQMAGLPVVAADLMVLREVLAQAGTEETLRFHAVGDETAFATQVAAILADPPTDAALQSVAEAAIACHSMDTMIGRYLDILTPSQRQA